MTPTQRHLARQALGLGYGNTNAYRNRFAANRRSPDYAEWRNLVNNGYALRWPWFYGYGDHFALIRRGIATAIDRFDTLDPDIFID